MFSSESSDLDEDTAPMTVDQSIVRKKQTTTKSQKKQSKKKSVKDDSEMDDLDGFIVDDEEDTEKSKKKTTKSKAKSTKKPVATPDEKESQPVAKRKVSGAYRPKWLGPERDPPLHGTKSIPVGKPGCLENVIFVLTGLNESLTRDELTEVIQKYGGLIRSAVSGKTKYLVAGFEMEDGRPITEGSKYKAALAKGIQIINEDQVLAMIRASNPAASAEDECKQMIQMMKREEQEEKLMENHVSPTQSRLLTVKYAPSNSQEIIGNKDVIDNLRLWLQQWEDVIIHRSPFFYAE